MTTRMLFPLLLLPMLVACPEKTTCESVFDCAVGEVCGADGTCVVAPEPDPEPAPAPEPSPEPIDAGFDAGVVDAGAFDAGFDAGPLDGGAVDGGADDGGAVDSGTVDSGTVDSGTAGPLDAGFDAGPVDAGFDAGPSTVVQAISATGGNHTCAIVNGSVKCWGDNTDGQLGLGDTENRGNNETDFPPVNLGVGRSAIAVAAGNDHTCVILDDGAVKCWGLNLKGQLGLGDTLSRGDDESTFSSVNLGSGRSATVLAAGGDHTCVILDDGAVKCWGDNGSGQLGIGDALDRGDDETTFSTVNLGAGRSATAVALGGSHTCVILDNGGLKCWGINNQGQLGLGDTLNRGDSATVFATTNLGAGRTAAFIAAGQSFTCVVLDDGGVKCWGRNSSGQLGLGDIDNRGDDETTFSSMNLGASRTAVFIATGKLHTCVVLDDGGVKCWGDNAFGQLGLGDTQNRGDNETDFFALNLGAGRTAVSVVGGDQHTCAILDDSTVKCWGGNASGQLGLGDTQNRGDTAGEMGDVLPTVNLAID